MTCPNKESTIRKIAKSTKINIAKSTKNIIISQSVDGNRDQHVKDTLWFPLTRPIKIVGSTKSAA